MNLGALTEIASILKHQIPDRNSQRPPGNRFLPYCTLASALHCRENSCVHRMTGMNKPFLAVCRALILVLACGASGNGFAENDERPNIVLINLDDADVDLLDEWAINKYFPQIKRRIQDRGARFSNFHVVSPLCGPSRGSLFRGQYPHNTGIEFNNLGWQIFYDRGYTDSEMGMWMREAGYETALVGKYCHSHYPQASRDEAYVPPGWDHFHASRGGRYFRVRRIINGELITEKVKNYRTDLEAKSSVEIITNHSHEKPLFLYVAPFAPHSTKTKHGMVARRHKESFPGLRVPESPDFNEEDNSDKTPQYAALRQASDEDLKKVYNHYRNRVQSLLAVDDMVRRIFRALRDRDMLDSTYVFLTSDNGYQLMHHRSYGKSDPFDRTTRVQLIVRGPDVPKRKVFQHLLGHIDLIPTFLELAGADIPHFVDGKSFAPLLKDPAAHDQKQWQPAILIENWEGKSVYENSLDVEYKALRRFSDVYVEWANGDREYYDLEKDPYQLENNWTGLDPALKDELTSSLAALKTCAGGQCNGGAEQDPIDTTMNLEMDANFADKNVLISGTANDDKAVASVEIVIRNIASREYLGKYGFNAEYTSVEAKLSALNKSKVTWQIETELAPGQYWVSARAIDESGNEDPLIPTAFMSVMQNSTNQ